MKENNQRNEGAVEGGDVAQESGSASAGGDSSPAQFACEVCGATASRRGMKFRNASDVLKHQSAAHGRAAGKAASPERAPEAALTKNGQRPTRKSAHEAKFCPSCGLNLEVINAALSLIHEA